RLLRGIGRPQSRHFWDPAFDLLSEVTGLARVRKLGHAVFHFYPVYNVPEMGGEQVFRMQQIVETIFSHYRSQTRVPSFKSLIEQERKYFDSQSVTSASFVQSRPKQKPREFPVGERTFRLQTQEGWLSLLCYQALSERNYEPLINEIKVISDKH